jgi:hypothetical protein
MQGAEIHGAASPDSISSLIETLYACLLKDAEHENYDYLELSHPEFFHRSVKMIWM